jgi:hypothetical protein
VPVAVVGAVVISGIIYVRADGGRIAQEYAPRCPQHRVRFACAYAAPAPVLLAGIRTSGAGPAPT